MFVMTFCVGVPSQVLSPSLSCPNRLSFTTQPVMPIGLGLVTVMSTSLLPPLDCGLHTLLMVTSGCGTGQFASAGRFPFLSADRSPLGP